MGLDATIRSPEGGPLGSFDEVQRALGEAFPGTVFGRLPSGPEKIAAVAKQGVSFPPVMQAFLANQPARVGGTFEGQGFSAEFILGTQEPVMAVDVVLRGETEASEGCFESLRARRGWVVSFP